MNSNEQARALFLKMAVMLEESGQASDEDEALMIRLGVQHGLFNESVYDEQVPESMIELPDNLVVYRDENVAVRISYDHSKGEYFIKAHPVLAKKEGQPRGYMLGSNGLIFKNRNKQ